MNLKSTWLSPWIIGTVLAMGLSSTACDDGKDDDKSAGDSGLDGNGEGDGCIDTETVIGVDDMTSLGFTAGEVLALAAGEHQTTVTWIGDGFAGPAAGTTGATFSVETAMPTSIKFIDSEQDPDYPYEIDLDCSDRLVIETTVDFVTEDGLLDETMSATVTSADGATATWSAEIAPADMAGTFPSVMVDPDFELTNVVLYGTHSATSMGGEVNTEIMSTDKGPDGVAGFGIVGYWGDSDFGGQ